MCVFLDKQLPEPQAIMSMTSYVVQLLPVFTVSPTQPPPIQCCGARFLTLNKMTLRFFGIAIVLLANLRQFHGELWEQEVGKEVYIEASVEGLESVTLTCTEGKDNSAEIIVVDIIILLFSDKMTVKIKLEENGFEGVVYTRGSYKMGKAPCFYDAQGSKDELLELSWTFNQCKTKKEESTYTNVILVQQDDFLIFPGDMAFELQCGPEGQAQVGLADPDPGAKSLPEDKKKAVKSNTGTATFKPKLRHSKTTSSKDEL